MLKGKRCKQKVILKQHVMYWSSELTAKVTGQKVKAKKRGCGRGTELSEGHSHHPVWFS